MGDDKGEGGRQNETCSDKTTTTSPFRHPRHQLLCLLTKTAKTAVTHIWPAPRYV